MISLVVTITSFVCVLYIERRILNPNGSKEVYVVKADAINKGQIITKKNVKNLFKLEKRSNDEMVPQAATNLEELVNTYVKENMYKNQIVTKKSVEDKDDKLSEIYDKREINFKGEDISDVAGGIIREGDFVDVIVTTTDGDKVISEDKIQNVYVNKVFTADNVEIDRSNNSKPAASINFIMSAEDATKMENACKTGKVKLAKVIDKSSSDDDIKIEGEKQQ